MQKYIEQRTERVHQFTLFYVILGLFTKNESRFLIKFLINANQTKLKYSLLTSSFIQCGNKDVIIYPGASVSEFIRAIRSFISIDIQHIAFFAHVSHFQSLMSYPVFHIRASFIKSTSKINGKID